jgi:ADP-ribosylglycohydrolase
MSFPHNYEERVYAGVLGKIIGVYLGRPFEGASYEQLTQEFGEVNYYVHEKRGVPLIVTDDDISGTFTFLRALPDYGNSRDITPQQIGQTWLNYIIENRAILWWGGMGMSTEHTAFLRLKRGIPAPQSGSMETNGRVVAEQIGAQIFIDGCGLIAPGEPEFAADLARRFASVSHDGEAIYGAQVVAAMEAQAFVESDINKLIDTGLSVIPKNSIIYRLINDLRDWSTQESDWRKTREKVAATYGYDKYGGGCHMVPNHALIIHSLLHGEGDFQKSLMIVNTCGWDTDCNSGNVGCLLGIRGGLAALEEGPDWRGPVADRLFLPTADGGRSVTDALTETYHIVNIARALHGEHEVQPKHGARFHFSLPGAVQGFSPENSVESKGTVEVENVEHEGRRKLALRYRDVATGRAARAATATFLDEEAMKMGGYGVIASPTLYPGQAIRCAIAVDAASTGSASCRLYLRHYDADGKLQSAFGPRVELDPSSTQELIWRVDGAELDLDGLPIAEVGLEITSEQRANGTVYVDYLTWNGTPDTTFKRRGTTSLQSWVDGADSVENWWGGDFRVKQNQGRGLLIQGTREWTDYRVNATLSAHLAESFGLAARVQGMRRFYVLLLCRDGKARLVKALDGDHVLAEAPFAWQLDVDYNFALQVSGGTIVASIDGQVLFQVEDNERALDGGGIALVCEEGHIKADNVVVCPVS